jgi:probable rRNA maturation factor
VISVETAGRYARELGLSFDREIEFLVIHGALHLAGYDHETDDGEMNRVERKLRKELLK